MQFLPSAFNSENSFKDNLARLVLEIAGEVGWARGDLFSLVEEKNGLALGTIELYFQSKIEVLSNIFNQFDSFMLRETDLHAIAKVHLKILALLTARFHAMFVVKKSLKKVVSFLALPPYIPYATKFAWRLADKIWWASGDNSTDYNYYSKRIILAGVYSNSLLYFLNDTDLHEITSFIQSQLEFISRFGKLKKSLNKLNKLKIIE